MVINYSKGAYVRSEFSRKLLLRHCLLIERAHGSYEFSIRLSS